MLVWLLTGIWHGASLNFLLWGVYYGILLLAEKFLRTGWDRWRGSHAAEHVASGNCLRKLSAFFGHVYCMFFVMLGWNLFVFEDMGQGIGFLKALFGLYGQGFWNRETVYLLYNNAALLILCLLGSTRLPGRIGQRIAGRLSEREILWAVMKNVFYAGIFLLSIAWLVDATFNPFLYFRF